MIHTFIFPFKDLPIPVQMVVALILFTKNNITKLRDLTQSKYFRG